MSKRKTKSKGCTLFQQTGPGHAAPHSRVSPEDGADAHGSRSAMALASDQNPDDGQ